jgi:hypothetical protein
MLPQLLTPGLFGPNGDCLSFFDGFNLAVEQVPAPTTASAITLTGTATPADVLVGKTFYSTNAATQLTGKLTIPVVAPRTIIKRVENPADEALLMATGVLLVRNRELKRRIGKQATS